MVTGTALVATDGGALPEVTGRDGDTVLSCPAGDAEALAATIARGLDDPELRARVGAAGRQRVLERWTWRRCAELTVEQYREVLAMPANVEKSRRNRTAPALMLTIRFDRLAALGLRPGGRVLDVGAGFGRHAFELARRGHPRRRPRLRRRRGARHEGHVRGDGRGRRDPRRAATSACCAATPRGCRSPTASFDAVITSEVLEHIPDDTGALAEMVRVLRPGGAFAATVPTWLPEKINWMLSDEYHAPAAVGGHVRIYSATELKAKMRAAGLGLEGSHHAHALHSPYWWLKCAVGVNDDDHPPSPATAGSSSGTSSSSPASTRIADRVLSPVLGKSLVLYGTKQAALRSTEPSRRALADIRNGHRRERRARSAGGAVGRRGAR